MSELLLDRAGRCRSPATMPGFHAGRPPHNKGLRYPADPPNVEGIVAVTGAAGDDAHGRRLRGLIPHGMVVEQKNWPCSRSAIPFASIVGCLGALDHASRRNTASSAGNRWPQGQPTDGTPLGAALRPLLASRDLSRTALVGLLLAWKPAFGSASPRLVQAGDCGSRCHSRESSNSGAAIASRPSAAVGAATGGCCSSSSGRRSPPRTSAGG